MRKFNFGGAVERDGRVGHAGLRFQAVAAQALRQADDLAGQSGRDLRQASSQNGEFFVESGRVEDVVEAPRPIDRGCL